MAPRRGGGRLRSAQNHVAALQSDYDTDVANMTDTATPAPVPLRTNEELNLLVLKRHYPSVEGIVTVANFAVVYLFSPTGQWEKCGIEGTMFVCQLAPEEIAGSSTPVSRYDVIVINRKGLDNFSTEILNGEGIELNGEYIIIEAPGDDGDKIYGLWIFSEPPPSSTADIRAATAEIIIECGVKAEESRLVAEREAAQMEVVTGDAAQREAAERDAAQREAAERDAAQREAAERDAAQRDAAEREAAEAAIRHAHQQQSHPLYGHVQSHPAVGRQVSMNELFGQEPRQPQQFYHQPPHQPQQQPQQQPQYHQQPDPIQFFHQQGNHPQFPGQQNNPLQAHSHQNAYPQFNPQQANNPLFNLQQNGNPQFNPQPHNPSHFNTQQYPGPPLPPQAFPPGYNPQLGAQQPQPQQQQQQQQQRDVIGDLFRNAKHGYNG